MGLEDLSERTKLAIEQTKALLAEQGFGHIAEREGAIAVKEQQYTLLKKAWRLNPNQFKEPWFAPDGVYMAETKGKAKAAAMLDIEGMKDKWEDEITFLTVRLERSPYNDLYLANGERKTKARIESDKIYQERADRLRNLIISNPDAKAYIKKGGYLYRPNACGYTERKIEAGVYTVQEAVQSVLGSSLGDYMDVVIINIDEHNKMINDYIETLKTRLICQ